MPSAMCFFFVVLLFVQLGSITGDLSHLLAHRHMHTLGPQRVTHGRCDKSKSFKLDELQSQRFIRLYKK